MHDDFLNYCKRWTGFWNTVIVGLVLGCAFLVVPAAIYDSKKQEKELENCLAQETKTDRCKLVLFKANRNKVTVYFITKGENQLNETVEVDSDRLDEVLELLKKEK